MEGFVSGGAPFLRLPKKLTESRELGVCLSESPVNPHYPLQHCSGGLAEYKLSLSSVPQILHRPLQELLTMRKAEI